MPRGRKSLFTPEEQLALGEQFTNRSKQVKVEDFAKAVGVTAPTLFRYAARYRSQQPTGRQDHTASKGQSDYLAHYVVNTVVEAPSIDAAIRTLEANGVKMENIRSVVRDN
jgi:hypothetical protein